MDTTQVSKGNILIAEPFLGDPNFERSVVLLCEHNAQGSFGFVLNQISHYTLKDVIDDDETYIDMPLYVGGPVEQNTLHFIHRLGDVIEDSIQISEGLYWGGNYEQLKTLLNIGKVQEKDIRFFVGYSGWAEGQLDQELSEKVWIVSKTEASFIFDTPAKEFWRSILRNMGGKHKMLSNYPIDPRLN